MFDKKNLLTQLISLIQDDIEKQRKSFEFARNTSIDAPGRMQSRYDTMGVESAWVADGLAKALNEKEMYIARLQTFQFNELSNNICLGSIIVISDGESSSLEYYFILPVASGYKLKERDITLTTITPLTPIGKVLIGKQVGEEIKIQFPKPRTIVIKEVV